MECRLAIRAKLPALASTYAERLGPDHLVDLKALGAISETALTRESEIAFAGNRPADHLRAGPQPDLPHLRGRAGLSPQPPSIIVLGVCETDYSGYPDCRDDTIKAMQVSLSLGLDRRLVLHTPLMWRDKAQTFALARELGGQGLLDLVIEESHSCYLGDRTTRHGWGYGCGHLPGMGFASKKASRLIWRHPTTADLPMTDDRQRLIRRRHRAHPVRRSPSRPPTG